MIGHKPGRGGPSPKGVRGIARKRSERTGQRARHTTGRRSTAGSLIFALLVGLLSIAAPTLTAAPAQAAPGDPFNSAAATVYIAQGIPTSLYAASTTGAGATTFTPVGTASNFQYNAVAYNATNNFIYANALTAGTASNGAAVPVGSLIRIGQDGYITRVGTSTFGPAAIGTFGPNGNYYLSGPGLNVMSVIDVTTGTLVNTVPLSRAISATGSDGADWAFKDGFFWSLGTAGSVLRINPTTGNIQNWALPTAPCGPATTVVGAGAAWTYRNDNLGFSCNETGNIVQISVANSSTPAPVFTVIAVNDGPPSTNNDGTSSPGIPPIWQLSRAGLSCSHPVGS